MNAAIVWVAQYLLFVLAALVGGLMLSGPARIRWRSITAGVLGLGILGLLIIIAAALHTDPRPFVVNPALHPLFPHAPDNGFPSDHSAAAGLLTALAWRLHTRASAIVAMGAALVATARVEAHVHHLQDVVAGLLLGALAGLIALTIVEAIYPRLRGRRETIADRLVGTDP